MQSVSITNKLVSSHLWPIYLNYSLLTGAIVVMIVWSLDLQLPVQSVPSITNIVSLKLIHGKVYSIQHYVIKLTWMSFKLTMLVMLGTDCTGSCKSNDHTIMTTMAPVNIQNLFNCIWLDSQRLMKSCVKHINPNPLYWPIWQHISACGPFNISQDLVGLSLIGWLKISRYAECS
jgi:hypothetical protein